jgi:hypothetical protein
MAVSRLGGKTMEIKAFACGGWEERQFGDGGILPVRNNPKNGAEEDGWDRRRMGQGWKCPLGLSLFVELLHDTPFGVLVAEAPLFHFSLFSDAGHNLAKTRFFTPLYLY